MYNPPKSGRPPAAYGVYRSSHGGSFKKNRHASVVPSEQKGTSGQRRLLRQQAEAERTALVEIENDLTDIATELANGGEFDERANPLAEDGKEQVPGSHEHGDAGLRDVHTTGLEGTADRRQPHGSKS